MCSVFWDAKTWSTQSPWNLQEGRPTGSSKAWTIILWSISWFHKVWGWCILFILMLFCYSIQAGSLSDFYENCRGLELARNFQFPTLREVRDWPLLNCFTFIRYLSWENIFFFLLSRHKHFLSLWRSMWGRLHAWFQCENHWLVLAHFFVLFITSVIRLSNLDIRYMNCEPFCVSTC